MNTTKMTYMSPNIAWWCRFDKLRCYSYYVHTYILLQVMAYTDPKTVTSPRGAIKDLQILVDMGEGKWSIATFTWHDQGGTLGIRWNGDSESPLGNPQSRGIPTWFVLPDELKASMMAAISHGPSKALGFPADVRWLRIRPLPIRILSGKHQPQIDYDWVVERIDHDSGYIQIRSAATDHIITLYQAHIKQVLPDSVPGDGQARKIAFLELTVQMIFEDGHVRLELRN